jgi:hypothetical protein
MYMEQAAPAPNLTMAPGLAAALALCLAGVLILGLFPGLVLDWTTSLLAEM